MKFHYSKLHNMIHLFALNVFSASKGSNNYFICILHGRVFVMIVASKHRLWRGGSNGTHNQCNQCLKQKILKTSKLVQ